VNDTELILDIEGMSCASCITKVEHALDGVPGVEGAAVNLATRTATVRTSEPGAFRHDITPLIGAVEGVGYGAHEHRQDGPSPRDEARGFLRRFVVALVLTVPVIALTVVAPAGRAAGWAMCALATPVTFSCGWPFLRSASRAARHGTTTMDTLVAV
jgi:Cu+-exporting ATPase